MKQHCVKTKIRVMSYWKVKAGVHVKAVLTTLNTAFSSRLIFVDFQFNSAFAVSFHSMRSDAQVTFDSGVHVSNKAKSLSNAHFINHCWVVMCKLFGAFGIF